MLIAGDIGGTKTDLAIYSTESGPRAPLAQTEVRSADYASLQGLVSEFLAKVKMSVDVASFAIAGPVIAGHVKTTNLPWDMDEATLARDLNLRAAHLMNDLEAVARSVPVLQNADLMTLNEGEPVVTGPIAWDGLLTFWVRNVAIGLWIIIMAVVLGQAIKRQRAEDEAVLT